MSKNTMYDRVNLRRAVASSQSTNPIVVIDILITMDMDMDV